MSPQWDKLQKVAEGGEKEVFQDPSTPDKVIARFKESEDFNETPRRMKGRYYLTKILHLFFPAAIPNVHLAAKGENVVLVSEKKELDAEHLEHNRLRMLAMNEHDAETHAAYEDLYHKRDIHFTWDDNEMFDLFLDISDLGVAFDSSPSNLGRDKEGKLVYADNSFIPWFTEETGGSLKKHYDKDKILAKIQTLSEKDQRKATNYLERLEVLFEEELREKNP